MSLKENVVFQVKKAGRALREAFGAGSAGMATPDQRESKREQRLKTPEEHLRFFLSAIGTGLVEDILHRRSALDGKKLLFESDNELGPDLLETLKKSEEYVDILRACAATDARVRMEIKSTKQSLGPGAPEYWYRDTLFLSIDPLIPFVESPDAGLLPVPQPADFSKPLEKTVRGLAIPKMTKKKMPGAKGGPA